MATFAGAIHWYYSEHGALPESVMAVEKTGIYGTGAYRLPSSVFESWNSHSGRYVSYLPVQDWDGATPFVVAVQPRTGRKIRGFVVLGETSARPATEQQLREVLLRDNAARAKAGESLMWAVDSPLTFLPHSCPR
jgi:hypothetical protein